MNVLILGSGGREHALCWRLSQDESCQKIFVWPGNAGMDYLPEENRHKINCLSSPFSKWHLKDIVEIYRIDLVIPGAEKFLYEGVSDWCSEWNVPCFGPTLAAAELERSKLYSKIVMRNAAIPTAHFKDLTEFFKNNLQDALGVLKEFKRPVLKISGPSLGKGVFVCQDSVEAFGILEEIKKNPLEGIKEGIFVEEALEGEEISLFFGCNNLDFIYLGAAQDHKRLQDNDQGPNTGGMGAFSPVSWANEEFITMVTEKFLKPTLKEMNTRKAPFKGVLFLGLMVKGNEAGLLEYNVRFGDPETQVILPLISGDLTKVLFDLSRGQKQSINFKIKSESAIHVVKAAKGYPGNFGAQVEKGQKIIQDLTQDAHSHIFFAGVKKAGTELITDGGRVLGVTSLAQNKEEARQLAYHKLQQVRFDGEQFRSDIGVKA